MTPASAHAEADWKVCVTALAVIVRADMMDREDAVDRLVRQRARQPRAPEVAQLHPPKYEVARTLAMQIRFGELSYPEAETTLAIAIDCGRFSDEFATALEQSVQLLGTACRRLDRMVTAVADELQDEIAGDGCERQPTGGEAA